MTARNNDERIPDELIDQLLSSRANPKELLGEAGLLKQLTAQLIERVLQAEMTEHLGYEKHAPAGRGTPNSRNGNRSKTIRTESGELEIEVPRDREGSFEPQLVRKRQRQLSGFDLKVLTLYARGMTAREIQEALLELYGVEVSPDFVSRVTSAVWDEIQAWQSRPLEPLYPVVYLDALVVKIRDEGVVRNKSVYLAIGVNAQGRREILGLWIEPTEGARLWLRILNELKNRGIEDILILCCDGLKGFPEAIESAFPRTTVQTCIVHMIRNSLRFVSYKDYKQLVADLKPIYRAPNRLAAEAALSSFEARWGQRYPQIVTSWRTNWERVVPFLDFPPEIRRVLYTTNQIEAVNSSLRKLVHYRGHFPNDEAATKLLYLGLRRLERKWERPVYNWCAAITQLNIYFPGRLPVL
jgi:putative transposase